MCYCACAGSSVLALVFTNTPCFAQDNKRGFQATWSSVTYGQGIRSGRSAGDGAVRASPQSELRIRSRRLLPGLNAGYLLAGISMRVLVTGRTPLLAGRA